MDVFEAYDEAVSEVLGNKSTKQYLIDTGVVPDAKFEGIAVVTKLKQRLETSWEAKDVSAKAQNWKWRPPSDHQPTSDEVLLERLVVQKGNPDRWSYQMSTVSGLGEWSAKRCAIDLVRDHGMGRFTFIELKVGADDAAHAAFELLRYYLAYVWARNRGTETSGPHDVMKATRIDLVVLAPRDWYQYPPQRGQRAALNLDWLADRLSAGIASISPPGLEGRFRFESFDGDTAEQRAENIVKKFDA